MGRKNCSLKKLRRKKQIKEEEMNLMNLMNLINLINFIDKHRRKILWTAAVLIFGGFFLIEVADKSSIIPEVLLLVMSIVMIMVISVLLRMIYRLVKIVNKKDRTEEDVFLWFIDTTVVALAVLAGTHLPSLIS